MFNSNIRVEAKVFARQLHGKRVQVLKAYCLDTAEQMRGNRLGFQFTS